MKKSVDLKVGMSAGTVFLFFIFMFFTGCEDNMNNMTDPGDTGGSKGPGLNEVFIMSMSYNPSTITVTANTTITWTNKATVNHTVTSDDGLFDSDIISSGGTYVHTFTEAGTFKYHCTVHPSMTATVIVN